MKKLMVLVVAMTIIAMAGVAMAASQTNTLTVNATVSGSCKFNSNTSTLAFGVIDPTSASDAIVSIPITYRCTNGTAGTGIDIGNGQYGGTNGVPNYMSDGTNSLKYTLAITGDTATGTGFGAGQDKTATVTGTVAVTDFQNAVASSGYADSVILAINP